MPFLPPPAGKDTAVKTTVTLAFDVRMGVPSKWGSGNPETLVTRENIALKHRSATVRGRAEAALSQLRAAIG